MTEATLSNEIDALLSEGQVIPAHPLALTANRRFDERRQRALTRYYLAAGAGGIAVAVHTTQFRIREVGLLAPVLELAAEEIANAGRPVVKVAGILGDTDAAVREAELARSHGYHLGLVGLGALRDRSEAALIQHLAQVSTIIPVFGFYLQPSVGGRSLSYRFWREAVELPGLKAIKVAPFNRYATLDVMRAVWQARRADDVYLYTGNDDAIVSDLLASVSFDEASQRSVYFRGGLLGQWAVWTRKAVEMLGWAKAARRGDIAARQRLEAIGPRLTDANAAIFDAAGGFAGCIPGIHETLRRQGLLEGTWTLDRRETLSEGQREEIERVREAYPSLNDDYFVAQHLADWMK